MDSVPEKVRWLWVKAIQEASWRRQHSNGVLNNSCDSNEPDGQEAGKDYWRGQQSQGLLAGGWSWGPGAFLDTLCVRGMLMSGADEVPPLSPPQQFLVPAALTSTWHFPLPQEEAW